MSFGVCFPGDELEIRWRKHDVLFKRCRTAIIEGRVSDVSEEDCLTLMNLMVEGKEFQESVESRGYRVGILSRRLLDQIDFLLRALGFREEDLQKVLEAADTEVEAAETLDDSLIPSWWERLWLHGLILVMLGLAFVEWDEYGFYVLLRFVCCVTFGRWAFLAFEKDGVKWGWLWGVLAAGYNPFFPLSLGRDVWEWVNAGTMIVVLVDSWLAVRAKGVQVDFGVLLKWVSTSPFRAICWIWRIQPFALLWAVVTLLLLATPKMIEAWKKSPSGIAYFEGKAREREARLRPEFKEKLGQITIRNDLYELGNRVSSISQNLSDDEISILCERLPFEEIEEFLRDWRSLRETGPWRHSGLGKQMRKRATELERDN